MTATRTPNLASTQMRLAMAAALAAITIAVPAVAQDATDSDEFDQFDAADFPADSHVIDHPFLPLAPGTRSVWTGTAIVDDDRVSRRIVTVVTDLTKQIAGVSAAVLLEQDYNDGELVESELAFRAQDTDGNVWHLGEYTELWEEGEFVGGQAWMQDHLEGARAGIIMQADPQLDRPSYAQGFAPDPYFWTDRGQVVGLDESVSEAAGDFEGVLVVAEFDASDPTAQQLKSYAPAVGLVRVSFAGTDEEREELGLVLQEVLDEAALAEVREIALAHEGRALVYSTTGPATRMGATD